MSIAPTLRTAPGQESLSTAHGNVAHLPRKSTNYVVDKEENFVNLNDRGLTAAFRSRWVLGRNARRGHSAGQDDPRKRRMVSMNLATEIGFDKYASQPPSRIRSSSPFIPNPVTATTGMALSSGSSLSHLVTSSPETSGS